jgi:hypothetical protein
MDEFSLKILAYIIKGFFITIKRSYESFANDLEAFIEMNIKGINKKPRKKEIKTEEKEKGENLENAFTFQNLSLFSENTQFEKFLSDTNMTDRINKTLKKISKYFNIYKFHFR